MKRKMIAGVLSTVLAFTMLSTGSVTEVKAEETDAKYYTEGTVTDSEGAWEICVGDKLSFEASVYLSTDDSEVTTGKWRYVTDKELLAIDGIDDTDLCYMYAPNNAGHKRCISFCIDQLLLKFQILVRSRTPLDSYS